MEDAQVAEVRVAEQTFKILKLLGSLMELAALVANLGARGPINRVAQSAVFQVHVAQAEQTAGLVARLAGVVILLN